MKNKGFKKMLIRLITYRPWTFILALLCNIVIFSYSATEAYFVRKIFNTVELSGINQEIFHRVIPFIIGILVCAVLRIIVINIAALVENLQWFYYTNFLRNNIVKNIFKKRNIKNIAGKSGKAFEVVANDTGSAVYPSILVGEVIGYLFYTLIAIGSLLLINWRVTVYIFIPVSIAIIIIRSTSDKLQENRKVNREIHEKVSERISDVAKSVQTTKVFGAENSIVEDFHGLNKKRLSVILKDTLFESTIGSLTSSTVFIGTAVMMLLVAKSMMKGEFLVGDFSMFVWYLGALASCVDRVKELVTETKQAEVSYNRIVDLVGEEKEEELREYVDLKAFKELGEFKYDQMKRNPLKVLQVDNLSYSYHDNNSIEDVSFNIKRGMMVALAGEVGSGKSTVINLLMGIIPKDSGKVLWNGREVVDQKEIFIPPNVSYTPQISKLSSETLKENILMGKEENQSRVQDAIYRAVLEEDICKSGLSLENSVGALGNRLSGGQMQRVALARMFSSNSELYVMDDSTSSLDSGTEKKFWERFHEKMKEDEFACIIASNKKHILEKADKVLFMKNGRIIDSGEATELSNRCVEFQKIYQ